MNKKIIKKITLILVGISIISFGIGISFYAVSAYQEDCKESFYDGFDKCNMDYRSEDPHYYTQVQKNNWDRKMELKAQETQPRIIINDFENEKLAIGNRGLWLEEIVYYYPNNLTSDSTVSQTDYYLNGKLVRNFWGYDETNPTINFTSIHHSCIEFADGEKTGIDILSYYGIITIGCEDWMLK